jgi:hypothetical protein
MDKCKCTFPGCRRTTKSVVEWEHGLVRVRARTMANWPGLEDGWYCPLHFGQLEDLRDRGELDEVLGRQQ